MDKYRVYSLLDENGEPFYIGCTLKPMKKRLSLHKCRAKLKRGVNKEKDEKIFKLLANGFELNYEILADGCNKEDGRKLEKFYIKTTPNLLNYFHNPNYSMPLEHRALISLSMLGNKNARKY